MFRSLLALFCILAACEPDPGNPSADKQWTMVYEELPAALLSAWGSSGDDVFLVGSDPSGSGPLALHWDGAAMRRLDTGATGDLWWVFGSGPSDPVYMSGKGGLALRYERAEGTFTKLTGIGSEVTVFGIYPVPGGRVWAVGGERSTGRAYVLDGDVFTEVTDLPSGGGANNAFFKVWGRSEDDLWIVGLGARAFHRTASGWQALDTPPESPLFTAHGNDDETLAVGGFVEGKVLNLGASITNVSPSGASRLNGVWVEPDGIVTAVGAFGEIWQRTGGDSWRMLSSPATVFDYHGVYVDPGGAIWAVGGQVSTEPLRLGMLAYYGSETIPAITD